MTAVLAALELRARSADRSRPGAGCACSRRGSFSTPAAIYVEVVRGTPLLVQILFIYFVLPTVGVNLPAFTSGVIALTLNSAAYLSEIFRAGIESIDTGQMEAARSLGHDLLRRRCAA